LKVVGSVLVIVVLVENTRSGVVKVSGVVQVVVATPLLKVLY
jgi:hypothetical protein